MTSNSTFFESPQAAAVYKHRLLRTYVPAWAGKVGLRAPGKRVFIYDAYSGPGRYDNQAPGSPELDGQRHVPRAPRLEGLLGQAGRSKLAS